MLFVQVIANIVYFNWPAIVECGVLPYILEIFLLYLLIKFPQQAIRILKKMGYL